MRVIVMMALASVVAGCSTRPPAAAVASPARAIVSPVDAAVAPAAAAVASPSRSPSSGSGAVAPGPASAAATTASTRDAPPAGDTVDQDLLKRGYKPGLYEGKVYYCKWMLDEEHFRVNRCYTPEQIKAMDRATQGVVNHLNTPGTCQGWGCH